MKSFPFRTRAARLLAGALILGLSSCKSPPAAPEEQVRRSIARIEALAAERDIGGLKDFVSEQYRDDQGNDRQQVAGVLTFYFYQHKSIYVFTRIGEITIPEPGKAKAVVLAALAGTPIAGAGDLAGARADLYRFEFEFAEEEKELWRVTRAAWRPAAPGDFL